MQSALGALSRGAAPRCQLQCAASQCALVDLLANMSFACRSTTNPNARFLRVFSDGE
jgi:hypothetical protein